MEVLCGVFVLRGVAAADVTARETQAQVDPVVAGLEAFLAAGGAGLDVADLTQMRAGDRHDSLSNAGPGGRQLGRVPVF